MSRDQLTKSNSKAHLENVLPHPSALLPVRKPAEGHGRNKGSWSTALDQCSEQQSVTPGSPPVQSRRGRVRVSAGKVVDHPTERGGSTCRRRSLAPIERSGLCCWPETILRAAGDTARDTARDARARRRRRRQRGLKGGREGGRDS